MQARYQRRFALLSGRSSLRSLLARSPKFVAVRELNSLLSHRGSRAPWSFLLAHGSPSGITTVTQGSDYYGRVFPQEVETMFHTKWGPADFWQQTSHPIRAQKFWPVWPRHASCSCSLTLPNSPARIPDRNPWLHAGSPWDAILIIGSWPTCSRPSQVLTPQFASPCIPSVWSAILFDILAGLFDFAQGW